MRKLIFFSKKREILYSIEGNSILTDFASLYLKKHTKNNYYSKKNENSNFITFEKFYLPERLANYFDDKSEKKLNFTLITDDFIIPITNSYEKFKERVKKVSDKNDINKFEFFLNNLSEEINFENFSKNFIRILNSILAFYGFFYNELNHKIKIQTILKDFFSKNFVFYNNFSEKHKTLQDNNQKQYKIIKLTDSPKRYKVKSIDAIIANIKSESPLPDAFIIYTDKPIVFEKFFDFYIVKNCTSIQKIENKIKQINPEINIEKKLIKSYKGLISNNNNFLGRYATEPYNPYDLINSVWRYFNEKERIK